MQDRYRLFFPYGVAPSGLLTGDYKDDVLFGGYGDDTLMGKGSGDLLIGDMGNDRTNYKSFQRA